MNELIMDIAAVVSVCVSLLAMAYGLGYSNGLAEAERIRKGR